MKKNEWRFGWFGYRMDRLLNFLQTNEIIKIRVYIIEMDFNYDVVKVELKN